MTFTNSLNSLFNLSYLEKKIAILTMTEGTRAFSFSV